MIPASEYLGMAYHDGRAWTLAFVGRLAQTGLVLAWLPLDNFDYLRLASATTHFMFDGHRVCHGCECDRVG